MHKGFFRRPKFVIMKLFEVEENICSFSWRYFISDASPFNIYEKDFEFSDDKCLFFMYKLYRRINKIGSKINSVATIDLIKNTIFCN